MKVRGVGMRVIRMVVDWRVGVELKMWGGEYARYAVLTTAWSRVEWEREM
jgi:hypothetical protein